MRQGNLLAAAAAVDLEGPRWFGGKEVGYTASGGGYPVARADVTFNMAFNACALAGHRCAQNISDAANGVTLPTLCAENTENIGMCSSSGRASSGHVVHRSKKVPLPVVVIRVCFETCFACIPGA